MLIYVEGCSRNARSGYSFVYGPEHNANGYGRLEYRGPFGGPVQLPTMQRADLRAVVAALRFRNWVDEGCTSMVIAINSVQLVRGITLWVKHWVRNGWRTIRSPRGQVQNSDLWKLLLGEIERWHDVGLEMFWSCNPGYSAAVVAARRGADGEDEDGLKDLLGA